MQLLGVKVLPKFKPHQSEKGQLQKLYILIISTQLASYGNNDKLN